MKRMGWCCLFLGCFVSSMGAAQVKARELPPGFPPQAGSITLDVNVTNARGIPVTGLGQRDFTLFDNGKPVAIRSFKFVDGAGSAAHSPVMILLIDEVNASFYEISPMRVLLEDYLRRNQGRLPVPVQLAFLTDKGVKAMHEPTRNGNELAAILQKQPVYLRALGQHSGFYGAFERMEMSLQALHTIAGNQVKTPGRKVLVWISPGWPMMEFPGTQVTPAFRQRVFEIGANLSAWLIASQMTVDSVDPIGPIDANDFLNTEWRGYLSPMLNARDATSGKLALPVLATHSGGLVLAGSNNVAGEIAECAAEAESWYQITFSPQHAEQGLVWHALRVEVDRPGVKVRTRNGYYAEP